MRPALKSRGIIHTTPTVRNGQSNMKHLFDVIETENELVTFITAWLLKNGGNRLADMLGQSWRAEGGKVVDNPILSLVAYLEALEEEGKNIWGLDKTQFDCLTNFPRLGWNIIRREATDPDMERIILIAGLNASFNKPY